MQLHPNGLNYSNSFGACASLDFAYATISSQLDFAVDSSREIGFSRSSSRFCRPMYLLRGDENLSGGGATALDFSNAAIAAELDLTRPHSGSERGAYHTGYTVCNRCSSGRLETECHKAEQTCKGEWETHVNEVGMDLI